MSRRATFNPPALGNACRKRWFAFPLSTRLTLIIVALLCSGLTLAGTTVVGILQSHLVGQVDAQLATSARQMAKLAANNQLAADSSGLPTSYYLRVDLAGQDPAEYLPPGGLAHVGRPSADAIDRLSAATGLQISLPTTIRSTTLGEAWRAQAIPVFTTSGETSNKVGTVVVALPLTNVQETLNNTAFYLLVASTVLIGGGGLAAYYLVRLSLSELRTIEVVAGRIVSSDMSERIHTREPDTTEVGSLTRSLNQMLTRIEQSFLEKQRSEEKMRRFISDASHELRTPLAAVRGYGELYRLGGVPHERVNEVMARIESEATRMGGMVEDLLRLARLDEGRRISMGPVDLVASAREAALDLTALDPTREVSLTGLNGGDVAESLVCKADRGLITQILTNLLGNVTRYTPKGTHVDIAVGTMPIDSPALADIDWPRSPYVVGTEATGEAVCLRVIDHGPGVDERERSRIFERFYRVDDSRSRDTGGTGLGLSIVATAAHVHGGCARALETPGGGLTMEVIFPRHDAGETT